MHISTLIKFSLMAVTVWALSGCVKDKCSKTVFTKVYTPVLMSTKDYWASAASGGPREINRTGKIYVKDQYIFVSEPYEGIHIIDNGNPASPQNIAFVKVMGNVDMAIKGNVLYADSYSDLTVFDISDPRHISFIKRLPGVMTYPVDASGMLLGWKQYSDSMVVGYTARDTTYTYDCTKEFGGDKLLFSSPAASQAYSSQASSTGKGGSMARFTILKDYLYTVNWVELRAFSLAETANPVLKHSQTINSGIETIFPYGQYLFIGSRNAMYIYDIANPAIPQKRSEVTHFRACDPVVVEGNKAYVTIRSGTNCGGNINQLQVFDISNVDSPVKLSSVEMKNPFGLGIDHGKLFICEGTYGLRFLDAADVNHIVTTKLVEGVETFDVIPFENQHRLLVSAKDGIYQYDYSVMNTPQLLSKIAVKRP